MSYKEGFLYLFESIEMPSHYIIMQHGKDGGENWYNRFNRLNQYDETENKKQGRRFGYPEVKVKNPIAITVEPPQITWQFESFVKENYVKKIVQSTGEELGSWGWYVIEKVDSENWIQEFYTNRNKQLREAAITENTGKQTTMF